jgi:hypothetical protein
MTDVRPHRRARSGWPVSAVVIVLDAAVQAALVADDPVPAGTWMFALRAVASLAAMVLSIWIVTAAAVMQTAKGPAPSVGTNLRLAGLAWTAGSAVLAVAVAVIYPLAVPLVLLLAAVVLPAAVGGARHPIGTACSAIRRAPVRSLVATIIFLVCCAITFALALAAAFFVTGVVAAALTWLWFGLVATLILALFADLDRRPVPATARPSGPSR